MAMEEMAFKPLDFVVLLILGIASVRGVLRGLLREAFSIAALAAACLMVTLYYGDAAEWLIRASQGHIGEVSAPWIGGALLGIASIGVVTLLGRLMQRGAKFAGLGWADRTGGAVLGSAEGVLVAALMLSLLGQAIGRDHPVLARSRSLEALEQIEQIAQTGKLPAVAAGPRTSQAK